MNPRRASALAALLAVCAAAPSLAAQMPPADGATPADTLRLTLSDAQRRALTMNPAFLADATAGEIARGELRHARVYSYNPQAEFDAPGSASAGELGAYEARLARRWSGPGSEASGSTRRRSASPGPSAVWRMRPDGRWPT